MIGKRFERLLIVGMITRGVWQCLCSCGTNTPARTIDLTSGHKRSCGCLRRERVAEAVRKTGKANKTHGMAHAPEYAAWRGMKARCTNKNHPSYHHYGGRGIRFCSRWLKFENFFEDLGRRPSDNHELDRQDVNGHYTPNNCRWVLPKEQQRNRRSNTLITFNGRNQCISAWAEEFGLTTMQLWSRLKAGWDIQTALNTPVSRANAGRRR